MRQFGTSYLEILISLALLASTLLTLIQSEITALKFQTESKMNADASLVLESTAESLAMSKSNALLPIDKELLDTSPWLNEAHVRISGHKIILQWLFQHQTKIKFL